MYFKTTYVIAVICIKHLVVSLSHVE